MNFNDLKAQALSKKQMRAIKGGLGTCGFKSVTGTVNCGVSKAQAQHMAANGGNWCCDSCASSSYCGK